jgi:hypothetical protein
MKRRFIQTRQERIYKLCILLEGNDEQTLEDS